ncbi:MAG TPA: phosphonopyruvate decarboxylase [Verrucomicrobiae bacterium]
MIKAAAFIEQLRGRGFSHWAGVPCSYLKPFINYVIDDKSLNYTGAASEGEAVGISMGTYLAGKNTVTMCQNSGLGNMVNPLTSLNYPFRVPTLLITTWRGEPDRPDEPQHVLMGQITHQLLETMRIPWAPFPTDPAKVEEAVTKAESTMRETQLPFALVMSQGSVEEHELQSKPELQRVKTEVSPAKNAPPELIRTEALQTILESLHGNEAIIATTGKTGRELFTIADRSNHLYVVGGMGTASAIGLGICLGQSTQPVVVIDGDGAALMKLGAFATIGYTQPPNFLHIILDNEAHDSTGGQGTASPVVDFARIAAAANYRNAISLTSRDDLVSAIKDLRNKRGPSLVHVKIRQGSPKNLGRPTVKPHEVKERFMQFLANNSPAK